MSDAVVAAVAVVIAALVGIIPAMATRKLRRENSEQHAEGRALTNLALETLVDHGVRITAVEQKVDDLPGAVVEAIRADKLGA